MVTAWRRAEKPHITGFDASADVVTLTMREPHTPPFKPNQEHPSPLHPLFKPLLQCRLSIAAAAVVVAAVGVAAVGVVAGQCDG